MSMWPSAHINTTCGSIGTRLIFPRGQKCVLSYIQTHHYYCWQKCEFLFFILKEIKSIRIILNRVCRRGLDNLYASSRRPQGFLTQSGVCLYKTLWVTGKAVDRKFVKQVKQEMCWPS